MFECYGGGADVLGNCGEAGNSNDIPKAETNTLATVMVKIPKINQLFILSAFFIPLSHWTLYLLFQMRHIPTRN